MKKTDIMPSPANCYPAPAIPFVIMRVFAIAALKHLLPYAVKWAIPKAMSRCVIFVLAAARLGCPIAKAGAHWGKKLAAVAPANSTIQIGAWFLTGSKHKAPLKFGANSYSSGVVRNKAEVFKMVHADSLCYVAA